MSANALHRHLKIRSLLPDHSDWLLDVGCGPVTQNYPYSDRAARVVCVDWKLQRVEPLPSNVECLEGDFTAIDLPANFYDTIIASDVFEHILLEEESRFVAKCFSVLRPGGRLVVSVPHKGAFAWLDPYNVRPAIHRLLWRLGLYTKLHNGSCDIRKGHKHYLATELVSKFKPLKLERVIYWGYLFDPLLSWATAFSESGLRVPGLNFLRRSCEREFRDDWGSRSFNMAVQFSKPQEQV